MRILTIWYLFTLAILIIYNVHSVFEVTALFPLFFLFWISRRQSGLLKNLPAYHNIPFGITLYISFRLSELFFKHLMADYITENLTLVSILINIPIAVIIFWRDIHLRLSKK